MKKEAQVAFQASEFTHNFKGTDDSPPVSEVCLGARSLHVNKLPLPLGYREYGTPTNLLWLHCA
jgi:hypothetical protein